MPLDEEEVRARLREVNSTTPSIQAASKWILERKEEIDVITRLWFEVYEKANDQLRIALVFLMNDAVQLANHEKERSISIAFHPFVVNAFSMANETVQKPIKRCLQIFRDRHVFPKHVIDEMQAALDGVPAADADDEDEVVDHDAYVKRLENYLVACQVFDKARTILESINFNFEAKDSRTTHVEGIQHLEGQVSLMIDKLQQFITSIKTQNTRTAKMQLMTKKLGQQFASQQKDVAVVHEAYERFAKGIGETIQALEDIVNKSEQAGQSTSKAGGSSHSRGDPFGDDMEMDDEDKPANSGKRSSLIPAKDYVPPSTYPTAASLLVAPTEHLRSVLGRRSATLASSRHSAAAADSAGRFGARLAAVLAQRSRRPALPFAPFNPNAPPPKIDPMAAGGDLDLRNAAAVGDPNFGHFASPPAVDRSFPNQFFVPPNVHVPPPQHFPPHFSPNRNGSFQHNSPQFYPNKPARRSADELPADGGWNANKRFRH
ncbi:CID domain-containing protein [Aphelenchoides fujianensis]|nr:CID domain-containing protein [Aphelenchoides fujianensis]